VAEQLAHVAVAWRPDSAWPVMASTVGTSRDIDGAYVKSLLWKYLECIAATKRTLNKNAVLIGCYLYVV
jgi:hypothetical protein